MATFNRNLQLQILQLALESYPDPIEYIPRELAALDKKTLLQNIAYLREEGMIKGGIEEYLSGKEPALDTISVTKDAINLLSEEGSISSSLKVVTVKLHDESLTALRDFINQNVSDPEEKKVYLQRLKELPADATKHIVLELVGKGLGQIPNAVQWLQTTLHQL
ncbi:hypothetical protein MT488_10390 [Enterobacter ludwigii]|uniref:hypothetical protein n=1 Tax=Enterobacter TaxID=547 RepID=UPI000682312C|nr:MULTISPECIES: hypothetical protein [Enterobacter cloacae complex]KUQ43735.1 hypothetical protein AWI15_05970 [Enterobacter hormaechei subsp. xiangfangensis]MDK9957318.1 hypothetical protein [Enterobacter hormaechei]MDZ5700963.1 hypothetical protein [Enterobacter ludwigii]UOH53371.1 hypothetical protein MT488_10390 [Enterobacter ludwigii]WNZ53139.1 hypothetical protein O0R42_09940 [Enterobacter hormaechei subsp. xiangfangensis]